MSGGYLWVDAIQFSYEENKVLQGVGFHLEKGAFLGIIGPNGSGKSTLLQLLAGVLPLSKGEISLDGKSVRACSCMEWARKVAIVFQEIPSHLHLPCFEVVAMGRFPHLDRWHGEQEKDTQIVQWAMEITHTLSFAERYFSELSGGEKQRVMLARALAQEPKILLLDEPTSHLDILHQLEVMKILEDLREKGMTIVGVFHDVNVVSQFCLQVLLLKKGSVLGFGTVEEVLTKENIIELLEVEFLESTHPLSSRPFFIPLKSRRKPSKELSVHLICGGGRGIPFMKRLLEEGFNMSVGIVNQLDSDEEYATWFRLPVAREVPFSPFGPKAFQEAQELAEKAHFVLVIPTFWGQGNLPNLDLALLLLQRGKRVFLFREAMNPQFDYTGGKAMEKLQALQGRGAQVIENIDDFLSAVQVYPPKALP
ncbi:MAG: ABC transporter ATP-binding protein [Candidatus Caldatribacteriaceae bacterium]